jgi:polar amino acid transport system substrate-binding protein
VPPPWRMRANSGTPIGVEIDMANDVAQRLGVKHLLVPVLTSTRPRMQRQGKIDLIIARLSVNEERRKAVGVTVEHGPPTAFPGRHTPRGCVSF